jgi:small subunit ribosomal protein S6
VSQERIRPYEGMFLFPQSQVADLQSAVDHIQEILSRAGAELISLRKWEERKLAYEIKGNKRGVYFLCYFKARSDVLSGIERDCNLSERLLRCMIIRADHLPQEVMEASDGRAELADEIRVRATSRSRAEDEDDEAQEPLEVAVESGGAVESEPA